MFNAESTATHEIGHAIIQKLFDVGPQRIHIEEKDGFWSGQSCLQEDALEGENRFGAELSQLAGPICQICCSEGENSERLCVFKDALLVESSKMIEDKEGNTFIANLGWGYDLGGSLGAKIKSLRQVSECEQFYSNGQYLFVAEKLLYNLFREDEIICKVKDLSKKLVEIRIMQRADFEQEVGDLFSSSVFDELFQMKKVF